MEKITKVSLADVVLLEQIRQYLYTNDKVDSKVKKDLQKIFDYLDNKMFKTFYDEQKDFKEMELLVKTTFKD